MRTEAMLQFPHVACQMARLSVVAGFADVIPRARGEWGTTITETGAFGPLTTYVGTGRPQNCRTLQPHAFIPAPAQGMAGL